MLIYLLIVLACAAPGQCEPFETGIPPMAFATPEQCQAAANIALPDGTAYACVDGVAL